MRLTYDLLNTIRKTKNTTISGKYTVIELSSVYTQTDELINRKFEKFIDT